jgi:hypothetical protein
MAGMCSKPDEKYKGCARWKFDWVHEQRAFMEYIYYDFNRPDDIRVSLRFSFQWFRW